MLLRRGESGRRTFVGFDLLDFMKLVLILILFLWFLGWVAWEVGSQSLRYNAVDYNCVSGKFIERRWVDWPEWYVFKAPTYLPFFVILFIALFLSFEGKFITFTLVGTIIIAVIEAAVFGTLGVINTIWLIECKSHAWCVGYDWAYMLMYAANWFLMLVAIATLCVVPIIRLQISLLIAEMTERNPLRKPTMTTTTAGINIASHIDDGAPSFSNSSSTVGFAGLDLGWITSGAPTEHAKAI